MKKTVILTHEDVTRLLPMNECIDVMRDALQSLATGEVDQPLRFVVRSSDPSGFLGLMPARRGGSRSYWGLKEVCVFPGNPGRGLDSHLGAVILHDGTTGELIAVAEASAITAVRTAAVSAVATDLLARRNASTIGIVGTGAQARAHVEAIALVRRPDEIRVAGSSPAKARTFVESFQRSSLPIRAVDTVEHAARDADIIVTVTSSRNAVLDCSWISAGTHINLVGSCVPSAREADSATIAAGVLYVDRRKSTVNESGDYLIALEEGAIGEDHIRGEIGELVTGKAAGRSDESEITIFKSLGLAIEDLAATAYLYEKAKETGEGTWIQL